MSKKEDITPEESGLRAIKTTGLLIVNVGFKMYFAFLYMIAWNWFLADKLFSVEYWEMLLGTLLISFIFNTDSNTRLSIRASREIKRQSKMQSFADVVAVAILKTAMFGILFGINVLISYYS